MSLLKGCQHKSAERKISIPVICGRINSRGFERDGPKPGRAIHFCRDTVTVGGLEEVIIFHSSSKLPNNLSRFNGF